MGLFERLGEKVERMKQQVDSAKTESAEHRCRSCEAPIYADLDACPECGSEDVARVSPSTEEVDDGPSGEPDDDSSEVGSDDPGEETTDGSSEEASGGPDQDADGPLVEEAEDSR